MSEVPANPLRYLPEAEGLELRAPAALVAFGGWVDAGSGGTGGVRHLISNMKSRKLAEIDAEDFYSFTDTRPLVSIVGAGERAIHWPRGEFHGVVVDEHPNDLVLFVAPEPNLQWKAFASVMLDGMEHFGVQNMMCIGSIFGAVSHRGQVRLTGWANDEQLTQALVERKVSFTNYEGPTGFVTVLLSEAEKRGMQSSAVYGFAPNYIQGVPNPRVSHALLRTFSAITGVPLELRELERAGRALSRQVDRLLQDQPQLREQVDRMLSLMSEAESGSGEEDDDAEQASGGGPAPNVELPSPQAVVNELEEFLRQLRREETGDGE